VKLAEAKQRILMVGHILSITGNPELQKLITDGALGKSTICIQSSEHRKIRTEENIL